MNCSQARILLSAYGDTSNKGSTIELDAHLEQCASCRAFLAQSNFVGEQIRSLPTIEPHPQAYQRLMQTLAQEHARFLQHASGSAVPTPNFLKPYLKEPEVVAQANDPLAVFSTAETGPLPVIRSKRRKSFIPSQYSIIAIAAAFLLVIMASGLISLLVLTNHNPKGVTVNTGQNSGVSINQQSLVEVANYQTSTAYDHVASALGDNHSIYYTAYNNDTQDWMLEQLDLKTGRSEALLPSASSSELILLGYSHGWLVWLQLDPSKPLVLKHTYTNGMEITTRTWSLHALQTGVSSQTPLVAPSPITLLSGTFNDSTAPLWVHTPVQGIWFTNKALLVATVDQQGTSRLLSIHLPTTAQDKLQTTEIAIASNGHILTSPTATQDGSEILWSEEWQDTNGTLHSDIWQQQTLQTRPANIPWQPKTITFTSLLFGDGMSFEPQIVNNTLFLLSTNSNSVNGGSASLGAADSTSSAVGSLQGTTPTASSVPTVTPTPNTATNPTAARGPIPQQNSTIYVPPADVSVQGVVLALPLNGSATAPTALTNTAQAFSLQAGADFLLWQTASGYQMYDTTADAPIKVGTSANGALFLAVSGHTAVWLNSPDSNPPTTGKGSVGNTVSFSTFNWPTSTQTTP